jgi:hypothetical protein
LKAATFKETLPSLGVNGELVDNVQVFDHLKGNKHEGETMKLSRIMSEDGQ